MNFILPIRIAQVILALLVLGTSAYGERALPVWLATVSPC